MAKRVSKVVVSAKKVGNEVKVTYEDVLLVCQTDEELKRKNDLDKKDTSDG